MLPATSAKKAAIQRRLFNPKAKIDESQIVDRTWQDKPFRLQRLWNNLAGQKKLDGVTSVRRRRS